MGIPGRETPPQSTRQSLRRLQGAHVGPVGDIELDMVLRIAVRGRTRDLAQLLEAVSKAGAVVMWVVEGRTQSEEQGQKNVTTAAGGFSR
jgi:hypothetical protein